MNCFLFPASVNGSVSAIIHPILPLLTRNVNKFNLKSAENYVFSCIVAFQGAMSVYYCIVLTTRANRVFSVWFLWLLHIKSSWSNMCKTRKKKESSIAENPCSQKTEQKSMFTAQRKAKMNLDTKEPPPRYLLPYWLNTVLKIKLVPCSKYTASWL